MPENASHLFGFDPLPGVVAVEVDGGNATLIRAVSRGPEHGTAALYPEERVREQRVFTPWLVAGAEAEAERRTTGGGNGPLPEGSWTRLAGTGLCWLVEFRSWAGFLAARDHLRAQGHPHFAYAHPVKQFLVRSGVTLFQGLSFGDIRRLQFDLETTGLRTDDPAARILLIVASDNRGGEWVFSGRDERRIVEQFAALVRERDPDALEGHNLFGFDLPYLAARAKALDVPLNLGRNGAALTFSRERNCPIGGITRPFAPAYLWGRHFLDTLLGVQRFDVGRGELESHGLKQVAVHYRIASEERVYLDRSRLSEIWEEDPERVRRYAVQDVQETRRLAELVFPTEFYQSQMVPESFQNVAVGGSGEKINTLLIREYLRQGHAIPQPQPPVACPGGHTEIRRTGILRHVVKADVESLYPSIMLHYGIRPASDTLGVFLPMLAELTSRRFEAKAQARARKDEADGAYWDGLQGSFKILINSFYGYLGAPFHFNDFRAAAEVTTTGQRLVRLVADALEESGSQVIEIDTDGVYFVPPDTVTTEEQEHDYVARIGDALPAGIRLAHDGSYAAMISLKIKNYVLVGPNGKKIFKGASLRSRADEAYGREFIARAVERLLAGDLDGLAADYAAVGQQIRTGTLPIEQFSRRERVTEKTFKSEAKRKSRAVAKNVQVGDTIQVYQRNDGSLGLVEEYAADEDRWHYLEKLHKFAARLEEAVGPEFERVFPRPARKQLEAELSGQMSLF
jgi:DNA polymerase elongation subunit (family B)